MMLGPAWAYEAGRMTGSGAFFCPDVTLQRVTHTFELNCATGTDVERSDVAGPNRLEIGLSGGSDFHLTRLKKGLCSWDKPAAQNRPATRMETFYGEGLGTFNGLAASIIFTFTDAGETGTEDTAQFEIKLASSGATMLECKSDLPLILGNHRAYGPGNQAAGTQSGSTVAAQASALADTNGSAGALYSPFASSEGTASLKASTPPQSGPEESSTDVVVVMVGAISSVAVAAGLGFVVLRFLRTS
ncbi:hypothetical protein QTH97_22295 [Variovorax sp. J22R24]|uniref:hypothetical protein n=1 Tax=Variovorax gracilis TaxID=3053502 RepID=UPI00257900DB|nr:hypothetical protein [Variovorax sp. J22R24]MDM0107695.1 hypothetical protein [Variovorax sp. J22R24]